MGSRSSWHLDRRFVEWAMFRDTSAPALHIWMSHGHTYEWAIGTLMSESYAQPSEKFVTIMHQHCAYECVTNKLMKKSLAHSWRSHAQRYRHRSSWHKCSSIARMYECHDNTYVQCCCICVSNFWEPRRTYQRVMGTLSWHLYIRAVMLHLCQVTFENLEPYERVMGEYTNESCHT